MAKFLKTKRGFTWRIILWKQPSACFEWGGKEMHALSSSLKRGAKMRALMCVTCCLGGSGQWSDTCLRNLMGRSSAINMGCTGMVPLHCSWGRRFLPVSQPNQIQPGACENVAEQDCLEVQANPNWGTPMRGWRGNSQAEENASSKSQLSQALGRLMRGSQWGSLNNLTAYERGNQI